MLIYFEMISENMNINFKVFGKKEGNVLIFPDKSTPNTMINVTIGDNEIIIDLEINSELDLENKQYVDLKYICYVQKIEIFDNNLFSSNVPVIPFEIRLK
jgi:hypothetical protein